MNVDHVMLRKCYPCHDTEQLDMRPARDRWRAHGGTPLQQKRLPLMMKAAASYVAEPTGLEPATSDVTGRRSNQLNYDSG
jgi:hypothetical protein